MNGTGKGIAFWGWRIRQNEGTLDRVIRVILGSLLLSLGIFGAEGIGKAVLIIAGALALITGIVGFCLLYVPLGISTKKKDS